jgi:hypothetical protein
VFYWVIVGWPLTREIVFSTFKKTEVIRPVIVSRRHVIVPGKWGLAIVIK